MRLQNLDWDLLIPRILWRRRVCPLCSSFEFTEDEVAPPDRWLRLFSLVPVRCINCRRRYYWFAKKDHSLRIQGRPIA